MEIQDSLTFVVVGYLHTSCFATCKSWLTSAES